VLGTQHNGRRPPFDAVVAVGSQGALDAFQAVVEHLPETFPAPIVFDLHRSSGLRFTEQILERRAGALAVRPASHGALEPGTVYLGPCDRQIVFTAERRVRLWGPEDSGPSQGFADVLLESAARALGPRVIAVVLSGRLDGGARGVRAVKSCGGRVLVQDPSSAVMSSMPNAALATGCVDFALPPGAIGDALLALCGAAGAAELFRVRLNAGVVG
jgi:two-component system, chemotaxis family, protein-glutamate methylesterase/glutaminase